MQFRNSLLTLFAMDLTNGMPSDPSKIRYLGVAYHINDAGNIATCAHIVRGVKDGETLVATEFYGECMTFRVNDIRCHEKYDFAVCHVSRQKYEVIPIHGKREIELGTDVLSYGFTSNGVSDGRYITMPRLFKGHIVRVHDSPILPDARSTCEISYPSHNGFSGTPVLFNAPKTALAGMLFSNYESTITLHKFAEVEDSGTKFSEEIHKVVELGIAHTAFDVRCFLRDLGISRVALDTPQPDELP